MPIWVPPTDWKHIWLPTYPFATNDLNAGIRRMPREDALTRKYVQANPDPLLRLLVVDIDHRDGELRALSGPAKPTAIAVNRKNGHAHAIWALSEPVTTSERGSLKAKKYAAAVTEGLRRSVDGDANYRGLIMKNPLHPEWDTLWLNDRDNHTSLWTLPELEAALGETFMPDRSWRRSHNPPTAGQGRNCGILENASRWVYREMRHYFGDSDGLLEAIQRRVDELNATYPEPLPHHEARDIAKSIHRWITTESYMWRDGKAAHEAKFRAIQSARARKPRPGAADKPRPDWHTQMLAEHVDAAPTTQDPTPPTAKAPYRRNITASAAAEKYGKHPRSIRRVAAQPRKEYEADAQTRQATALQLREQGLTYAQIGDQMGITGDAAAGLIRRALTRKEQAHASESQPLSERDTPTAQQSLSTDAASRRGGSLPGTGVRWRPRAVMTFPGLPTSGARANRQLGNACAGRVAGFTDIRLPTPGSGQGAVPYPDVATPVQATSFVPLPKTPTTTPPADAAPCARPDSTAVGAQRRRDNQRQSSEWAPGHGADDGPLTPRHAGMHNGAIPAVKPDLGRRPPPTWTVSDGWGAWLNAANQDADAPAERPADTNPAFTAGNHSTTPFVKDSQATSGSEEAGRPPPPHQM